MPPYQIIRFEQAVGFGVTGASWAAVRAVLKADTPGEPFCVANELICGQLGHVLGLPIPPCGLFADPQTPTTPLYFGTLSFNISGYSLPHVDPRECMEAYSDPNHPRPDAVTGVLIFDAWILNGDRHVGNLALDTSRTPHQLHVFDHSWALFGRDGVGRLRRLQDELGVGESSNPSGNRHCLLDAVRSAAWFGFWLGRVARIPDFVIDDVVAGAMRAGLIDGVEAAEAVRCLKDRRDRLPHIIRAHRNQFTGIPDAEWSAP